MRLPSILHGWGNENEIVISMPDTGLVFCSYGHVVAHRCPLGVATLDCVYWNYSPTTKKWLGRFLGDTPEGIRQGIASGTYRLADLNEV